MESDDNRVVYALLAFFPYKYDVAVREDEPKDPMERRAAIANEAESVLDKKENNERIDRIIWNIVGNGHSEYTNMETFVRIITEQVLPETEPDKQTEAWEKFKKKASESQLWKNNTTLFMLMWDEYQPVFQAFKIVGADEAQWVKWIAFYFRMVSKEGIRVEMVEALNYCDLTKKNVFIHVIREFNQCRITGNMNAQKGFRIFLKKYLSAISCLGYTNAYLFETFRIDSWVDCMFEELPEEISGMIEWLQKDQEAAVLQEMKEEYADIIRFLNKCNEMIQTEKEITPREVKFRSSISTKREHEEEYQRLKTIKNQNPERFEQELEKSYRDGKLNPREVCLLSGPVAENT